MNLYIVATPIGNLQDITLRAADTLLSASLIVTESTSKAGTLLAFLEKQFDRTRNPEVKIISLTEDEEENKIPAVLALLNQTNGVLISEAGTPLVSDPGFKLVREAIKREVNVIPIPGPTAVIAALSAAGLPTDKFTFLGFLPKTTQKKQNFFLSIKDWGTRKTMIVFDSPDRIKESLDILFESLGDVDVVIARELTKIHEEFIRGKVSEVIKQVGGKNFKGEITLLFSGSA